MGVRLNEESTESIFSLKSNYMGDDFTDKLVTWHIMAIPLSLSHAEPAGDCFHADDATRWPREVAEKV